MEAPLHLPHARSPQAKSLFNRVQTLIVDSKRIYLSLLILNFCLCGNVVRHPSLVTRISTFSKLDGVSSGFFCPLLPSRWLSNPRRRGRSLSIASLALPRIGVFFMLRRQAQIQSGKNIPTEQICLVSTFEQSFFTDVVVDGSVVLSISKPHPKSKEGPFQVISFPMHVSMRGKLRKVERRMHLLRFGSCV